MTVLKIAVIQLHSKPLQVKDNHLRACKFIREAASRGADLAVLPEYHLTGWDPENPAFVSSVYESESYLEIYCALAAELKINILPGTILETSDSSPLFYNKANFISSTGCILGSYQKANLWPTEREYLASILPTSSPHQLIRTPLGPVGILICWDLAIPEGCRALVAQGAKIIIIPACWNGLGSAPAGLKRNAGFERQMLQSLVTARAFENSIAVVFVNVGGEEGSKNLGLSQVSMPFTGPTRTPMGGTEGLEIFDLDMDELKEAEEYYNIHEFMTRA